MAAMPDSTQQHDADEDFDRKDPAAYPYFKRDILRWGDCDSLGHINNVVFARFFESGRIAFMNDVGAESDVTDADDFVIAHLSIDFLAEMHYPGEVMTGVRVIRTGRSSFRMAEAIFVDGECKATGDAVCVRVSRESGGSAPLSDAFKARLQDPPAGD
jgi:acyl-CoA thioester hydrolase